MSTDFFFVFDSELSMRTFQAAPALLRHRREGVHQLLLGEYSQLEFPIRFEHESGTVLSDFLDTGWPGWFLISERVCSSFRDRGLTGWKTYPIMLVDKRANEVQGYCGLSFTGRAGPIEIRKSEVVQLQRVPGGRAVLTDHDLVAPLLEGLLEETPRNGLVLSDQNLHG